VLYYFALATAGKVFVSVISVCLSVCYDVVALLATLQQFGKTVATIVMNLPG